MGCSLCEPIELGNIIFGRFGLIVSVEVNHGIFTIVIEYNIKILLIEHIMSSLYMYKLDEHPLGLRSRSPVTLYGTYSLYESAIFGLRTLTDVCLIIFSYIKRHSY